MHRDRGGPLRGPGRGQLGGVRPGHPPDPVIAGRWPTSNTSSPGRPTWAGRCASVRIPLCWKRIRSSPPPTARPTCPNGTGTATRSTTATGTRSAKAACGSRAPRPTGISWSSSSIPRDASVLVGTQAHPELKAAHLAASVVRGVHRGGHRQRPERLPLENLQRPTAQNMPSKNPRPVP